ncbi:MAG: phosphoribosylanthranilate isomerase [Saprospiraceae bacterium]|nr:phosphoribosylanthranilate isomerase [Saprospiraceae bacterium]
MIRVKVCCIKSNDEADLAIHCGAYALGLVGPMPSGPGPISPEEAGIICSYVSGKVNTFYLTSKIELNEIVNEYNLVKSSHLQLTDSTTTETRKALKIQFPNLMIVQVVHVSGEGTLTKAKTFEKESDFLLLDSGAPGKAVKELGGTGRIHNWEISKQIVRNARIPVFLAGGLNASNVKDAINHVNPYGLDLCSGIRTEDKLDKRKIKFFFSQIKSDLKNAEY